MSSAQTLETPLTSDTLVPVYYPALGQNHPKVKMRKPEEWTNYSAGDYLTKKTYSIYRDTPRRISGSYAVKSLLPVPMMSCFSTNAPCPDKDIHNFSRENWLHFYEPEDTLCIYSWEIGENTWISTPERAMIETAFISYDYRYPEWLLRVLLTYEMDPDMLFETSESLGMNDGFRRLAAILTLYPYVSRKKVPVWVSEIQEYAEYIEGPDILLCEGISIIGGKDGDIYEDFGVFWNFDKQEVINAVFT